MSQLNKKSSELIVSNNTSVFLQLELYDRVATFLRQILTTTHNTCFLMATKCYKNIIAMNSSIIQSIIDIYKCCTAYIELISVWLYIVKNIAENVILL